MEKYSRSAGSLGINYPLCPGRTTQAPSRAADQAEAHEQPSRRRGPQSHPDADVPDADAEESPDRAVGRRREGLPHLAGRHRRRLRVQDPHGERRIERFLRSEADHLVLLGILYAVVFAGTAAFVVPVAAGLGDSWNWSPFTLGTVAFFTTALIAVAVTFKANLMLGGV